MASETSSSHRTTEPFSLASGSKKTAVMVTFTPGGKGGGAGGGGGGRLLRKPRLPKLIPQPPPTPPPDNSNSKSIMSEFLVEPEFYFEEGDYTTAPPEYTFERSGTSPPPPSEFQANSSSRKFKSESGSSGLRKSIHTQQTSHSGVRQINGRFVLDPIYREQTNIGTYVEGKALVQPFKPRGPDALPARVPVRKNQPLVGFLEAEEEFAEDERYYEPPEFTLQDFVRKMSDANKVPLEKVKEVMFSKHNYKKIQNLLAEHLAPKHTTLTKVTMNPPENMPKVTPRIPQKQLLIEMAALIKEQMSSMIGTSVRPIIRSLPKYSPDYKPGMPTPHTEIVLYEDNPEAPNQKFLKQAQASEMPGTDNLFSSPTARYFQGSRRSNSPFVLPEEEAINPAEMAVLDCLMNGAKALSLKANFISQLPDIELLATTITYLNLSFNEFSFVPYEVFELEQLTTLKMRNNPIREIPNEISALKNLRTLVFSFCLVTSLPIGLFSLKRLQHLDFAYNKVSFIPNEIKHLRHLRELNMEGNQLPAVPMGILRLHHLKYVRVRNNFMHPLFWKDNTTNSPPRLFELSARIVHTIGQDEMYDRLPENIKQHLQSYSKCDCCKGPMYGPGLRLIRPVSKIFNIKNLPIMFHSCSPDCMKDFKSNQENLVEILYGVTG